jgi:hypothetical protein
MSALNNMALAKASFIFQPPDKLPMALIWLSLVNPTDARVSMHSASDARIRGSETMN